MSKFRNIDKRNGGDDKNEQTPQTPFNEPTSEVKVYTEAEANYVAEEPSENTLVFGSNTPDNVLPKVGEIIQMPISEIRLSTRLEVQLRRRHF